ncbi:hypothetical protein C0991_000335, partial [Blastosporella zonata]
MSKLCALSSTAIDPLNKELKKNPLPPLQPNNLENPTTRKKTKTGSLVDDFVDQIAAILGAMLEKAPRCKDNTIKGTHAFVVPKEVQDVLAHLE